MLRNSTTKLVLGCSAIAIAVAAPADAATLTAGCGGGTTTTSGAPSLSATEISTSQAVELIRQRRLQVADLCPAGTVSVGGFCQPQPTLVAATAPAPQPQPAVATPAAAASATPAPAAPAAVQQPAAKQAPPQPKAKAPVGATLPPAQPKTKAQPRAHPKHVAPQQHAEAIPSADYAGSRVNGAWAETFLDFERHKNINGGEGVNPTRHQRTAGVMAGADWGMRSGGVRPHGHLLGVLGGYTHSDNSFSNARFVGSPFTIVPGTSVFRDIDASGVEQTLEGGSFGVYGVHFSGGFSTDLTYKVDFWDIETRGQIREQLFQVGCAVVASALTSLDGSTRVTNHTVAANANYKLDIGRGWYMEPTTGVRFTYGDFASDAAALGLADGHAVRVQGGLRFGTGGMHADGSIWTLALTGLLYSDVAIDGFVAKTALAGLPPTIADVDEGKLRALGMIQSRITMPSGYAYYGQIEVRGGEDVIGGGGKVGIRYEW